MSDHASAIRGQPRWHPNPHIRSAIETIRRDGWQVTAVDAGRECPFAYTAGMVLHDIPDLAVYGLDPQTGPALLNELADLLHQHDWRTLVCARAEISTGAFYDPVRLIEIIDKDDLLMANLLFPDTPALQVVWPDENGHYPWHDEYTLLPLHQPVKGIDDAGDPYLSPPRVITPSSGLDRTLPRKARRMNGH